MEILAIFHYNGIAIKGNHMFVDMGWLNKIVDSIIESHQEQEEIIISSGVSPSGTYHVGTLREVLSAEVIARELRHRGRTCRHIHVVDDLDVFRKVPVDVPETHEQYLGMPLCDVPAPDGSDRSYADFYLDDLRKAAKDLKLDLEIIRAHERYREGFFTSTIEQSLKHIVTIRTILETVSGRKLDEQWSPIQIVEDGYLKTRAFSSIDEKTKTVTYLDQNGESKKVAYDAGLVKLNWRIDWPARWSLLGVDVEPFGRDHATKGGSYDTGVEIAKQVFNTTPPIPVPYDFINRSGETKKMSKSKGDVVTIAQLLTMLPAEVVWFFVVRFAPDKLLFFDEGQTLMRLVDEFAELSAKENPTPAESQLLRLCTEGITEKTISRVPFSHLVASYQAALRNADTTLDIIARTEHADTVREDGDIIKRELRYINEWLNRSAPEEVKFNLLEQVGHIDLTDDQKQILASLADKIAAAPKDADGQWFHDAMYAVKEEMGISPQELFAPIYQAIIGKSSGPRAGWFLSILPHDWLVKRLKLQA